MAIRHASIIEKTVVMNAIGPICFREQGSEFNIYCAIDGVQLLLSGVHIAMNGWILDPAKVRGNMSVNRLDAAREH